MVLTLRWSIIDWRRFNILENNVFNGEQEHVFGTSDNLLPFNGKAIQSQDIGGWNELTPSNKGKKNVGRPRKVLSDISNKSSTRTPIVLRSNAKNSSHDSTITLCLSWTKLQLNVEQLW
ncbi:hypothetical protein Pyn_19723 [Prunus yedoensis var. nudiflora]|uniref:Uncharacterized protein n=1 Tax=Prunus yedoensis var. nudiflora TaxID=2094558 RepID=A0A314U8T2_PRUYE|nr:hypothetical protein Pyn_19723 [Prunus yedoensis var. nudiflora]